jgi:hypothetical protein
MYVQEQASQLAAKGKKKKKKRGLTLFFFFFSLFGRGRFPHKIHPKHTFCVEPVVPQKGMNLIASDTYIITPLIW